MDAIHATIALANTAEAQDLDADYDVVQILNRGTTDPIYATVGGTSAAEDPAAPTVGGRGTLVVTAGETVEISPAAGSPTRVRLIAASAVAYSVVGMTNVEHP